jgi:hypothetical protein
MNDAIVMLEGPDQRAQEIDALKRDFMRYTQMDDLRQPCPTGRLVGDHRMLGFARRRRQSFAEVIGDDLDVPENLNAVVSILCRAAKGENVYTAATELLLKLADGWAELRCDL